MNSSQDKDSLISLISQLEEAKFVKLFRLIDELHAPIIPKVTPIDIPDSDMWIKYFFVHEIPKWFDFLVFINMVYLPASMAGTAGLEPLILQKIRSSLKHLRDDENLRECLLEPTSKYLSTVHIGGEAWPRYLSPSRYTLFTNVQNRSLTSKRFKRDVERVFQEELGKGFSKKTGPLFGVFVPEYFLKDDEFSLDDKPSLRQYSVQLLIELLNAPSSFYIVAREGEVRVAPVRNHGFFLSSSTKGKIGSAQSGLSASVSSNIDLTGLQLEQTLLAFEDLLNNRKTREVDIQSYFEQHPEILFGVDERFTEIRPHVCLVDPDDNREVPDFMARVEDTDVWHTIELKRPSHPVVVDHRGRGKASSKAAKAIAQLLRNHEHFYLRANRARARKKFSKTPYEPVLVGVIGRGSPNTRFEWRSVRKLYPDVSLVTYDYLLHRARQCARMLAKLKDDVPK